MKFSKYKVFKIVVIVPIVLLIFNFISISIYDNFYLNGNNEENIKRSINNIQDNDIIDEEIEIIRKLR